jgi:hypothetical protein
VLFALALIAALTAGFIGPLAPPDPEAFKVTTPNLGGTATTRLQVSGNEDTAKAAFLNSDVGIGTASPGEKLEVSGAVKIANATGTADGTIRWTGTDFEGRKGGAWVSLTAGGGADISAKVKKSANQSIPNATSTVITWDQEQYDTDTMHDVTVNNSRITFNRAGKYVIVAQGWWAANATGYRDISLRRNGSQFIASTRFPTVGSTTQTFQNCTMVFEMSVGDYCEVVVIQNSGGALDFLVSDFLGSQISSFTVQKVDKGG